MAKRRFLHVNEYLDAARRGLTKAQAAAELGITLQGVHMAALRHGISFTKPAPPAKVAPPKRSHKAAAAPIPATARGGGEASSRPVPAAAPIPAPTAATDWRAPSLPNPVVTAGPSGGADPNRHPGGAAFPSRVVASLRDHGLAPEEARHVASLQLKRSNSPPPSVAADRAGITRYPNQTPFRLGDPARLHFDDHHAAAHAPSSHGAST